IMKKKICWLIVLLFFLACTQKPQSDLLHEVVNKPTSKTSISLNSVLEGDWTLYFGVQDENAPQRPKELKKSKFFHINAAVPGNVEIDLLKAGLTEDPLIGDNVYDFRT